MKKKLLIILLVFCFSGLSVWVYFTVDLAIKLNSTREENTKIKNKFNIPTEGKLVLFETPAQIGYF